MVAATFPNLSFENPPGTGPTLVSGSVEPFQLEHLDNLEVRFAGETVSVFFLDSDFVDISQASADEVAALLEERIEDLSASNDGGAVRLTSKLTGEDVELEILGGAANFVLNFPGGSDAGVTYAGGPPNDWNVLNEVYSVMAWAAFADQNTRPEEVFDGDWWGALVLSDDFENALFDSGFIPTPTETFSNWSLYGFVTGFVGIQAAFDQGLAEDFETGWGLPLYFAFTPANLETASASPEGFETDWGNGSVGAIGSTAQFANGTKAAEDFEGFSNAFYTATIVTTAVGDWLFNVNGNTFKYPAGGGDSEADVAAGLNAAITSGSIGVQTLQLGPLIALWPTNPDNDLVLKLTPPSGGEYDLTLAIDNPLLAEEWIGQDQNPDFD